MKDHFPRVDYYLCSPLGTLTVSWRVCVRACRWCAKKGPLSLCRRFVLPLQLKSHRSFWDDSLHPKGGIRSPGRGTPS